MTEKNAALLQREGGTRSRREIGKPILVGLDSKTGMTTAHRLDHTGSGDGYPVRAITTDLLEHGYGCEPVILKSFQEPSIVDLQNKVCERRSSRTIPMHTQLVIQGAMCQLKTQRTESANRFGS